MLVIGSGGREHALVWKLAADPAVRRIYAAPGNPGIAQLAHCIPVANICDPWSVLQLAEQLDVNLTVAGPEAPLIAGIVDVFRAAGRLIIGPTQANARLEGSKVFAKQFFTDLGIPTARFHTATTSEETRTILAGSSFPLVVKADGLAAGKGVVIAQNRSEAESAAQALGPNLVFEEYLTGEEVSFIVLSDGRDVLAFEPCQDHKAAYDGDQGPNTGGMGAYCDSRIVSEAQRRTILNTIIQPTIERTEFTGFLFAGLIMTAEGPRILEYNVRLGDPETQPMMHRIEVDFGQLLLASARGELGTVGAKWKPQPSVCVVMTSAGYPKGSRSGDLIHGIENAQECGATVFHAGTRRGTHGIETAGGRVLGVTASGQNLSAAIQNVYGAVRCISFEGQHFRTDIGHKGLGRWPKHPIQ